MKDISLIISSAIEHSQELHEIKKNANDTDNLNITAILKEELETIQSKVLLLLEENADQKKIIHKLKSQIAGEHGFDVKDNVYYTPDGDGPFCPFCLEKRGKKIRLRKDTSGGDSAVQHACRMCDCRYSG